MNNNYAGNISDNKDNQLVYPIHYNLKPYFNIASKHILYTESYPTTEELSKLTNKHYTIIYIKSPDLAIIRNSTTRFETTPTKALWSILYNKPLSVHFRYYDFNANYPASISNIQKQLSTHNTPVKLTDLTIDYQLTIDPCASGTEQYIPDLNYDIYLSTLRPYLRALRNHAQLQAQLQIHKPQPISHEIITFVSAWAPAYDIDLPTQPIDSLYNYAAIAAYTSEIMTIYTQLRFYITNSIDISDSHTICTKCNLPYHINLDFCPHCDEPIDDEIYLHLD